MDNFFIEGTADSPQINLNFKEKRFVFEGRSLPENPEEFYAPVLNHLGQFLLTKPDKLQVDFKLDYFNTASSKKIYEILELFVKGFEDQSKLVINWFYVKEDEDMKEAGEDMKDLSGLAINSIEI